MIHFRSPNNAMSNCWLVHENIMFVHSLCINSFFFSKRAKELSGVLEDITRMANQQHLFKSFKVHFMDNPFDEVFEKWQEDGGKPWQLYEAVDSFHPNQVNKNLLLQKLLVCDVNISLVFTKLKVFVT